MGEKKSNLFVKRFIPEHMSGLYNNAGREYVQKTLWQMKA